jgi:hypothetical protein
VGPITLFDKSFLQSLSVDESVWFDHFFRANVCPLFYIETLADLEKSVRQGRTPEQEVGIIAEKFPEKNGMPNVRHTHLCRLNLLGDLVQMDGMIYLPEGRLVKNGDKKGVVYEQSAEMETFLRWQRQNFKGIEHQYAKFYRSALSELDFGEIDKVIGVLGGSCKTLKEAKSLAQSLVSSTHKRQEVMNFTLLFLNIPSCEQLRILQRWSLIGYPPLVEYSPYVAYVLMVELFLRIATMKNLISSDRLSNQADIAYLFYLPFCMLFVSSDRLHKRCAPLFLRDDQEFVWGEDLKKDLCKLNAHYLRLPDSTKNKGIMTFAPHPPKQGDFFVTELWDRHLPKWRELEEEKASDTPVDSSRLVREINQMANAPALSPAEIDFDPSETDALVIKRRIRKQKGSWYQIPKDIEDSKGYQQQ